MTRPIGGHPAPRAVHAIPLTPFGRLAVQLEGCALTGADDEPVHKAAALRDEHTGPDYFNPRLWGLLVSLSLARVIRHAILDQMSDVEPLDFEDGCEGAPAETEFDYLPVLYLRLNLEGADPTDDHNFFRSLVRLHEAIAAYALTEHRAEIPPLAEQTDPERDANWLAFSLDRIVGAINVATGNATLKTTRG